MTALTSRQRKLLRGLAHALEPVVRVGKEGVTAALAAEVGRALDAHELIKVRFLDGKREKDRLVAELEAATGAAEAGRVGHVSVLYREHPDPAQRKIRLEPED
jgi:RNA-binding protein